MDRKRAAGAAVVVAVEGRRRCNAAEEEVVDLVVLAVHRPVAVLAVVERKRRNPVGQWLVADLTVWLRSKDLLNIRMSCKRNEVDAQKEIHKLLCRVQQDLHRCSVGDARFGAASRIGLAGAS